MRLFTTNRTAHMTIVGQTGFGKTVLMKNLIHEDVQSGTTAIVFDLLGNLTDDLLAEIPADYAGNVWTLEVNENFPFGINLYEVSAYDSETDKDNKIDTIVDIFKKLVGARSEYFPTMEYVLRSTGRTLQDNPGFTMAEIPKMFQRKNLTDALLQKVKNDAVHDFWYDYYVGHPSPHAKAQLIDSTVNKLAQFLDSPVSQLIVGQEHTTIDFSEILASQGDLVLVHLPYHKLGRGRAEFYTMLLLSLLEKAIYERPSNAPEVHLYFDEYKRVASPTTTQLLEQARNKNVGITVAMQSISQLDTNDQVAVLQAGTLCFFQTIGKLDTEILARQLTAPKEEPEFVPKPRMQPNIKTWTEWEWVDEEKKKRFEELKALQDKIPERVSSASSTLSRYADIIDGFLRCINESFNHCADIGFFAFEISDDVTDETDDFQPFDRDDLELFIAGQPPKQSKIVKNKRWEQVLVPTDDYFYGKEMKTDGGLLSLTDDAITLDISRLYTKEEIDYFLKNRSYHREGGFFSRMVPDKDEEADIPDFLLQGGTVEVHGELYRLSKEAIKHVPLVKFYKEKVPTSYRFMQLLAREYERTYWYFLPIPLREALPPNADELDYEMRRAEVVEWLAKVKPPAIGKERDSPEWAFDGQWRLLSNQLQEAVELLRADIKFYLEREKSEKRSIMMAEEDHEKLERQLQEMRDNYYIEVEHQEQDGWIPVKTEEERVSYEVPNYSRFGPKSLVRSYVAEREHQIYDLYKDKPRPFSDLWAEMEDVLTTLPQHTCYVQYIENKQVVETALETARPLPIQPNAEQTAQEVRRRSLRRFGTPAEQVRKELQERIAPFLGGSDDKPPDTGKSGAKPKSKPKPDSGISGAKPYP